MGVLICLVFVGVCFFFLKRAHQSPIESFDTTRMLEVVGESYYRKNFRKICGKPDEDGEDLKVEATLSPETNNSHDANAVAVLVDGLKVGHLSRVDAMKFRKVHGVASVTCDAHIVGGWDRGVDDRGQYGVRLDYVL